MVENLKERYGRWILGVDRCTPGYIIREELDWGKMRLKSSRLALGFEEKVWKDDKRILVRECCSENWRRESNGDNPSSKREAYLRRCGWSSKGIWRRGERRRRWKYSL